VGYKFASLCTTGGRQVDNRIPQTGSQISRSAVALRHHRHQTRRRSSSNQPDQKRQQVPREELSRRTSSQGKGRRRRCCRRPRPRGAGPPAPPRLFSAPTSAASSRSVPAAASLSPNPVPALRPSQPLHCSCRSGVVSPHARRDVKLRFLSGFGLLAECGLAGDRMRAWCSWIAALGLRLQPWYAPCWVGLSLRVSLASLTLLSSNARIKSS
jgi:hypothetical protein